jgi:PHD/YefM family antitoxin component YafN of YafNO toxin-antitoxin module
MIILATTIRPSAYLRSNYNEISQLCKKYNEPVFITKNGHGDLAVMSMELYNRLSGKDELYRLIDEGLDDIKNGNVEPLEDTIRDLRQRIIQNEI